MASIDSLLAALQMRTPGQISVAAWNTLLKIIRMQAITSVKGGRVSASACGTTLEIDDQSPGAITPKYLFLNQADGTDVRVSYGTIQVLDSIEVPTIDGTGLDAKPAPLLAIADNTDVWVKLTGTVDDDGNLNGLSAAEVVAYTVSDPSDPTPVITDDFTSTVGYLYLGRVFWDADAEKISRVNAARITNATIMVCGTAWTPIT